jgi:hypothetical protein
MADIEAFAVKQTISMVEEPQRTNHTNVSS